MSAAPMGGTCDPRFAALREAFAANFTERGEPGGAIALMVDGRLVCDLWGGYRDAARTREWTRETLVNFFSVGKAFTALVALRLVERGLLDLDAPAHCLWPEFGCNGKETITLRHMLAHRAGLPAIREDLPDGAMLDWSRMAEALARQAPWWEPGTAHGYHVNTFGYLVGELVRRASGRSIGEILRDEIVAPLGADVHIGLPSAEHYRAAEFLWPSVLPERPPGVLDGDALMKWNTYWNPPGISGAGWVNRPEWRSAEIPSTNGHGTARGIARVYAALAAGGAIDGVEILSREMLAAATEEQSFGPDRILERESRFALGFQLPQAERPLGPNPQAFGHFGAGGSLGFCDPVARVAFGYVTNDMGPRWQNPRNKALLAAIYGSLGV
ncbi:serine hydrolase domain-containing protein [Parvibaculum sp.]|uniref:serine hydrolase domain-containing protein n=1 Tax=Parvibaculum sp. TaxID=2024848 RepID=UPI00391DE7B4